MEQLELFQRIRETIEAVLTRVEDKRFGDIKKLPENYHIIQELEAKVKRVLKEKEHLTVALSEERSRREMFERFNSEEFNKKSDADDASDIIKPVSVHTWSMEDNNNYYISSSAHRPQQNQATDQPSSRHPEGDVLLPVYDMFRGEIVPNIPQSIDDSNDVLVPVYDVTKSTSRPLPALGTYPTSSDPHSNDAMAAQLERRKQTIRNRKKLVSTNYGRPLPQLILPNEHNSTEHRVENSMNEQDDVSMTSSEMELTKPIGKVRLANWVDGLFDGRISFKKQNPKKYLAFKMEYSKNKEKLKKEKKQKEKLEKKEKKEREKMKEKLTMKLPYNLVKAPRTTVEFDQEGNHMGTYVTMTKEEYMDICRALENMFENLEHNAAAHCSNCSKH